MSVDLDASRGDPELDAQRITLRVEAVGGHVIEDLAPSGGRHLYLLLAEPVGVEDVLQVLEGWQNDCPSLDPSPMRSAHSGLIAPPGSCHKSGGQRELVTAWPDVQALIESPNPPAVWQALVAAAPPRERPTTPPPPALLGQELFLSGISRRDRRRLRSV